MPATTDVGNVSHGQRGPDHQALPISSAQHFQASCKEGWPGWERWVWVWVLGGRGGTINRRGTESGLERWQQDWRTGDWNMTEAEAGV